MDFVKINKDCEISTDLQSIKNNSSALIFDIPIKVEFVKYNVNVVE